MNKKIVIITVVISIILLIIIGIVVFTVLNKEESTSTQTPSSTSTQAPSSTSTQAPSSTSTQAPSSTSTQAPSSTSTQAPSSTNECIYGSFSNWSDCDKGKRIRTKRVLIKPTGKICEDIIEEDLEYCKGFNCILSDDWVKKQECSFDMTTGEYTETFTKEILQTPSKGGLTCEEVVELEQKENDTNDEPSTNRILPSYIRTFKNNIYSYFRENPQMKITSITNNLVTDQRPGSKYSCNAPCSNYSNTDTNLSVNCITELWNNNCLTNPSVAYNLNNFNVPNTVEYNFTKQTLSQDILNKSQTGGVGLYDRARILNCYGNTYTNIKYPYLVCNSSITNTTGRYTQITVPGITMGGFTTPTTYKCSSNFIGEVTFSNCYNRITLYGFKNILDVIFNIPSGHTITYNLTTQFGSSYPKGFTYTIKGPETTSSSTCPTSSLSITFSYAAIGEELYL